MFGLKVSSVLGAAAVLLVGAAPLPAQTLTGFSMPSFGPVTQEPADQLSGTSAVEALHDDIATRLIQLERVQTTDSELFCNLFRYWTSYSVFESVERRHRALAERIGQFSADGQRRAAEDIAAYVRRVGEIIRQGCPKDILGQPGEQNVQNVHNTPEPHAQARRILEGEELRRVMPNVAIAIPPRIELSNRRLQNRANRALDKMQTGIETRNRTLYEEGRQELEQIFGQLIQVLNTQLATPLDSDIDTKEAKQERVRSLFDESFLIDGFLKSVTYPAQSPKQANKNRGERVQLPAQARKVALSDGQQQALIDRSISLMKQGIAACDRIVWQQGLDGLNGVIDSLRNSNQHSKADQVEGVYPDLMFPACTQSTNNVTVGAGMQNSKETGKVQSFGFRQGSLENFRINILDNEDTQATGNFNVELPANSFGINNWNQNLGINFFEHSASSMADLISSNGNNLLLPASSNPGVFLAGGGMATDVTNAKNKYEGLSIRGRYLLSTDLVSRRNFTLRVNGGPVLNVRDIDISSSGYIPNFGFGPMFGFMYSSNIDVVEYGGSIGATIDVPVFQTPGHDVRAMFGGTLDFLRQDADGTDSTFLGGGTAGTLVQDTAKVNYNGSAINYGAFAGLTMKPKAAGNPIVSMIGFLEESEDSFYVERSGAVGGMARLKRDKSTSVGARLTINFRF